MKNEKFLKVNKILKIIWPYAYPCLLIIGVVMVAVSLKKSLEVKKIELLMGPVELEAVVPAVVTYIGVIVGCAFAIYQLIFVIAFDAFLCNVKRIADMRKGIRDLLSVCVPVCSALLFIFSLAFFIR